MKNEFYEILNIKRYGAGCKPAPAEKSSLSFRREETDVCHCYVRILTFVIATRGD
jgi:hypothetical protein